ncbi:uncharacterized protein [Mytilus edulis]|uniref:uncharacterized protein n=1 Tax=Mytilus edulis TaxID=6550 RepID=UPI0039EF2013
MINYLVAKILVVSFIFHGGCSFLLDSSTVKPSGGGQYLTTRHYMQLMDLLYEEKQTRRQLEQIVTTLQTKVDAMSNNGGQQAVNITAYLQPYAIRLENQEKELATVRKTYDSLLQKKNAEITKLSSTMTVLEQNYTSLLHDSTVTQTDYHRLKVEVEGLKQIKNLDVANGLQETKNDINMLKASNQARSQDFLALYNLTISAKKDISIAKKELDNIYNGSIVDTKIQDLNDKMYRLEISQNLTSLRVNTTVYTLSKKDSVIDNEVRGLNDKMTRLENSQNWIGMQVNTTVRSLSTKVGFTACDGSIVSGNRIKFRTVTSSHGISMASSYRDGIFIAPKAGFYLVLSNILSRSQNGFYIKKNKNAIARAWSHVADSNTTPYYSAPLSAFIVLSVNDVITIEGDHLDSSSCITIVKL